MYHLRHALAFVGLACFGAIGAAACAERTEVEPASEHEMDSELGTDQQAVVVCGAGFICGDGQRCCSNRGNYWCCSSNKLCDYSRWGCK
jgi:hypothetical protein